VKAAHKAPAAMSKPAREPMLLAAASPGIRPRKAVRMAQCKTSMQFAVAGPGHVSEQRRCSILQHSHIVRDCSVTCNRAKSPGIDHPA
jgi:hypothetical protein